MASSATDAGHAEKRIREQLVETGDVDCIVAVGNNFFYTRSLPCHLWFFDKGKKKENKEKILMIDARNVYRKVSSTVNDFSPDQMEGLTAIMQSFRSNQANFEDVSSSEVENNSWLKEHFPDGKYQDVEGLCKIVDIEEVREQDYSLTPGRYVGVSIEIDHDFDYQGRILDINKELAQLNEEANGLMNQIQSVDL